MNTSKSGAEIPGWKIRTIRRFRRPIVVLPAYNAASTLRATIADIPAGCCSEMILVDDCSTDDTVEIAESLGLTVIRHARNRGYGANQKTCYDAARQRGADAVVMLHPDYQYDGRLIPFFLGLMETGVCDVMLGNRIRTRRETLASGMPLYKYLCNRMLTIVENVVLGQNLGDFHSGFRCYTRQVLETVPYHRNSDDFVFDSQFLAQVTYFGFRLGDAPVPCRYFAEASSIDFRRSVDYGLQTIYTLGQFCLQRLDLAHFDLFSRPADRPAESI
ncbi:MAG: glycosyltransferase family 2 protein [Sedimentisphaerales bacterium]|nr:glycosyltransferase family 2 protein [Sedimentisphaerales bacterium]